VVKTRQFWQLLLWLKMGSLAVVTVVKKGQFCLVINVVKKRQFWVLLWWLKRGSFQWFLVWL